ncbi:MAG: T9SS type A sorting domain-containing protein [Bacteroidales bacterium]|nr:T9SS type A sorting domain-containing protein [Bacteroidales bacterium]
MYSKKTSNSLIDIDLSELENGIYIINVLTQKKFYSERIVLKK